MEKTGTKFIDVVFDMDIFGNTATFVEVENDERKSIHLGTWYVRDDGYHVIRLTKKDLERIFE